VQARNLSVRAVESSRQAICWIGKKLGDEAAADADGIFAELSGPDAFEAYADGREYGHVENGQQIVGDVLSA